MRLIVWSGIRYPIPKIEDGDIEVIYKDLVSSIIYHQFIWVRILCLSWEEVLNKPPFLEFTSVFTLLWGFWVKQYRGFQNWVGELHMGRGPLSSSTNSLPSRLTGRMTESLDTWFRRTLMLKGVTVGMETDTRPNRGYWPSSFGPSDPKSTAIWRIFVWSETSLHVESIGQTSRVSFVGREQPPPPNK